MARAIIPQRLHLTLMILGALAGLSGWAFADWLPDLIPNQRTFLFLVAWAFAFFSVVLALTGPSRLTRVLLPALAGSLVLAGALWWGAGRHEEVDPYMELVYPGMAYGMALLIATPFLAAALQPGAPWRDYGVLFQNAWQIVVRYVAAMLFTALFWGLLALSDALLRIVGLELMDWLTREDAVAWALTGTVFGLALAVVYELRDYISPRLVLRLLRLFVPLVLVVAAVFVVALPMRGWGGLIGNLSPAATLLGFAITAVVLVTIAVDQDRAHAVQARVMRVAVQALALLVPVLALLAFWAIWLRVGQYGWTPNRLMAICIAGVLAGYGLAYALSVLLRGHWMASLREANIWMALASLVICLVWLTPLMVPERITAQDQLARALTGLPADDLPLREMARDWGADGVEALQAVEAARPDLQSQIALAREGRQPVLPAAEAEAQIAQSLPVYPKDVVLPPDAFDAFVPATLQNWQLACDQALPEGPGCALYLGQFDPATDELEGVLFLRVSQDRVQTQAVVLRDGKLRYEGRMALMNGSDFDLPDDVLAALHAGQGLLEPTERRVLKLRDREIFPYN
ncbi:MAG: DUF4153 domain-containing protein [Paracoccaceae bacterium]|nr:DUF4153 domain-containing protein [Paracoccaceae bacterium]